MMILTFELVLGLDILLELALNVARWIVAASIDGSIRAIAYTTTNLSSISPNDLSEMSGARGEASTVVVVILFFIIPSGDSLFPIAIVPSKVFTIHAILNQRQGMSRLQN